ncbi:Protein of unknown function (DUF3738) [Terriglobus roseus DSM 18391]|uniref:Soil-associated protein, TIGR03435 family n=2 Tax=Terriglobus roseus TaxID=392734 RepID=I3ZJI5_TERRK|nr:Protein of unknown function (DUF3738) [Terriglobus roseus DSM 18391]
MVIRISAKCLLKLTVLMGSAILPLGALAQAAPEALRPPLLATFEIVSIHPMRQDDLRPEHIDNPSRRGYLSAVNVNLKSLMEIAYDIPDLRMFGGPTWLTSERFSVEAKADPRLDEELSALPNDQARQTKRKMISALLTARFQLAVHADAKVMPVYAMVVAKGGPRLRGRQYNGDSQPAGSELINIRPGNNTLQVLAYELSWRLGRPVLDRTGLQDNQAITLRWRDDEGSSDELNAPSLLNAMQEQLGLTLESTKGSVPILLIDHAEKPADN